LSVRVLVSSGLDAFIELALDRFPDRVAVRLDHHRAANGRVLGESGAAHTSPYQAGKSLDWVGGAVALIGTIPRADMLRTSRSPS
jgi:hypothetical protein